MSERAAIGAMFLDEFTKWATEAKEAKEKETSDEGPYHKALAAIDKALIATLSHMKAQEAGKRPKTTGAQLAEMWQAASRSLRGLDNNFATVCQYKGLGWINEAEWDDAEAQGLRTDIGYIKQKRMELLNTPDPDAPTGMWKLVGNDERRKRDLSPASSSKNG
jgi:hypothetical protein